jgi:hypothetical protein
MTFSLPEGLGRLLSKGAFWGHIRDKLQILTSQLSMATIFQGKIQGVEHDDDELLMLAAKLAG